MDTANIKRARIFITGIVQGVGFRPFVFNLANGMRLEGYVLNSSKGLLIDVEGTDIESFIEKIKTFPPPLAQINGMKIEYLAPQGYKDFKIMESLDEEGVTLISPDISVCPDCLEEIYDKSDRRFRYPFTNCTNCGPRFTITFDIPYDRKNTTMSRFKMCLDCEREYHDPSNRRFHAQPNACPLCGPRLTLIKGGVEINADDKIKETIGLLKDGGIVAIKGIGGFHLACDAGNESAVRRLREKKRKSNKPFALMSVDIDTIRRFCQINDAEEQLLLSPQRPIVLLGKKPGNMIAHSVAPGNNKLGVMLPYTPLHYLLFESYDFTALVMTSGNLAEEPIVIDNETALKRLGGIADAFLIHDRDIYMRADDSIAMVFANKPYMIRRSRGYVPSPIKLPFESPDILAVGGELKNTFAITQGEYIILSQHIGDVENMESIEFLEESHKNLKRTFRSESVAVAYDMHPDYLSTRWALEFARNNSRKTFGIQHHHAHIASCMAENSIDEKVIGVSFDGLGYGTDGNIWGGEFMIADFKDFDRVGHLKYIPMPGGDMATKEPWRMAVSYVLDAFKENHMKVLNSIGITERVGVNNIENIVKMINKGLNSPLISSAGRLFDAVASLIGISDRITFEGESAIALEALCDEKIVDSYPIDITSDKIPLLDFSPAIRHIVSDMKNSAPVEIIASMFHNTVADGILMMTDKISSKCGLGKVVLSGGVFQNMYLLQRAVNILKDSGYEVFTHSKVPTNDGGISLGQAVILSKRLKNAG